MKNLLNRIKTKINMKKNNGIDIVNSEDFKGAIRIDSDVKPNSIEIPENANYKIVSYDTFKDRFDSYRKKIIVDASPTQNKCPEKGKKEHEIHNKDAEERQVK